MSDPTSDGQDATQVDPQIEHGEIVMPGADAGASGGGEGGDRSRESVEQPAKVMRIGAMIKQLLDEVSQAPLDERSRDRLREVFDTSVKELGEALSDDLQAELARLAPEFGDDATPSDAE